MSCNGAFGRRFAGSAASLSLRRAVRWPETAYSPAI